MRKLLNLYIIVFLYIKRVFIPGRLQSESESYWEEKKHIYLNISNASFSAKSIKRIPYIHVEVSQNEKINASFEYSFDTVNGKVLTRRSANIPLISEDSLVKFNGDLDRLMSDIRLIYISTLKKYNYNVTK